MNDLEKLINNGWENRELVRPTSISDEKAAVIKVMHHLDNGTLRTAEPSENGDWQVNEWVKKAVLLYFGILDIKPTECTPFLYNDKIPLKRSIVEQKIRVVPGAIMRYATFAEEGAIIMPSLVNIGARVGARTMIDTWATVGSCAQVGKDVHIAGGVGIGGVLEPPQASPVIIEDNCFIGSRCIIVEGVRVKKGAVLGAGVTLTQSTHIIDTRSGEIHKGIVPAGCVVIPGTYQKEFPGGTYGVPCALILGERKESTDMKTSLNEALREYEIVS